MSGHSQFKNIMHRKGAQDAKRARAFTRIAREISASVRGGAADPGSNPRLRAAMEAARTANMPRERIERAVRSALPGAAGTVPDDVRYEGYGPGGVAIIVEAMTDNRNRTASELRTTFSKRGGSLGETNSVAYMFERIGRVVYPASAGTPDAVLEAAIDAGAQDAVFDGEIHEITGPQDKLGDLRDALESALGTPQEARLAWRPVMRAPVTDLATAQSLLGLLEALDELDDVQRVETNAEIEPDILDQLEKG
ncbi:MAG: YebC/PmpR family DNA-binding transcriptional regulator [Alphaproteobacteria bacterium]|nr:MAG: YebC/PmpR family DNA-binding transcriptional regulator [Alphaproteobacteria bacterium]